MKFLAIFVAALLLILAVPANADICTIVNPTGCPPGVLIPVESIQTQPEAELDDICTIVNPTGCPPGILVPMESIQAQSETELDDICTIVNPTGCPPGAMFSFGAGLIPMESIFSVESPDSF